MLQLGFAKKQLTNMLKAVNKANNNPILTFSSLIASGNINQLVSSLRTCIIFLSLREKQELALGVMSMICNFAVPGLLSSLPSLCGEETFLRDSKILVLWFARFSLSLSYDSPATAVILIEAGWAVLLVKAFRARPDDELDVEFTRSAIYFLLFNSPGAYRTNFSLLVLKKL
mmetsp:Transcript_12846/g.17625  ORF Transcript_12846/g.17625 Transcript_12846/m.17625 type:complete len:172 (-) Transcript_12846:165-680(-)